MCSLATVVAKPETQVVTHLCYSDFEDILPAIDGLEGVLRNRTPFIVYFQNSIMSLVRSKYYSIAAVSKFTHL